jgi:hypothetical protein
MTISVLEVSASVGRLSTFQTSLLLEYARICYLCLSGVVFACKVDNGHGLVAMKPLITKFTP